MGCDIHLRVEYLAPAETLNERLEVVPEGSPEWTPAEKLTPVKESSVAEYAEKYADETYQDPYLEYNDRWYQSRDYHLFGALAGVRDHDDLQIWEARGLPTDVSDHVREDCEGWGEDGHSQSWQTLDELLNINWKKEVFEARQGFDGFDGGWSELLERMKDVAFARCGGDQTHVRIVYWFDN